ncbi:DUF1002 domain-containing protein [Peptostreptococcus canis]|uniref:DUF1002 domain-containing protein n=1 Tax=Peptostreptococcus canis TaxID=1159213 RepID=A0ABR6TK92_9FIRM|nr:DUF1002 domain-containing protein [Peptostreptococcus canis]MBC2575827.1 DUF1002 domain-containing protein [Peptostreptococcus canis]MBP1998056.1 uncharacterized protein YpuA (DUF1002 family) [Peptostreptococcus canis]
MKNKILSVIVTLTLLLTGFSAISSADSTSEVITLGANLNKTQKKEILNYFGVDENNPNIIYVNNQQERKYLTGIAPEEQLGRVTMSSSYVVPTSSGGINVKTSNITWVTSSMIASTLATAGVENANVVAAAPFPVSGTGALTGIIIAFEKSSGEQLTEEKKQLANKELITTGNLADKIGKDKATGVINDSKKEVIKENIKDPAKIEEVVKNIANNYNVNLSTGDINVIVNLLQDVGNQNYNYKDVKDTLNNITSNVVNNLKGAGENINVDGLLEKTKSFLNRNKDAQKFFNKFDESKLSNQAVVSTTNEGLESAKNVASDIGNKVKDSGFLDRIINFIKSLF